MMILYDEEEIMRSYIESEIYEASQKAREEASHKTKIETAKRMLRKKKYSLEEIADCFELSLETVKELEAELFQ